MKKYVAYYRVSTVKQGASGLGLEAQLTTVKSYIGHQGELIGEFKDIESGKRDARPELLKALQLCKQEDATLVIAKLDRLSRNIRFIVELQESKVSFICCDMPQANELTIHIFAAMAQYERKIISERTKAGLSSKKDRIKAGKFTNVKTNDKGVSTIMKPDKNGVYRLGNPNGWDADKRSAAVKAIKHKAATNVNTKKTLNYVVKCLQLNPNATLSELAQELNEDDYLTPTGKPFSRNNVQYIRNKAFKMLEQQAATTTAGRQH